MNDIDYRQLFAENLRKYREAAAYTLEDVAFKSGISSSVWSGYENNRGNPTIDTLAKICETLSIPMNALIGSNSDYPERQMDLRLKTLLRDISKLEPEERDTIIKAIRLIISLTKAR